MIEKNWLKIGEVASALGISAKELRYWEQVVPEIRPRRSKGNLRYYHRGELPRLARIRDWLAEGLTVADCRQLLLTGELKQGLGLEIETAPPTAPAPVRRTTASVAAAPVPEVAQARQALAALLERLGARPALPPRKRARKEPPADPPPGPAPEPTPEVAPKPAKSRRKPPAPPSEPDSFGPLFDLS